MTINRGAVSNHKFWDQMGRVTPIVEYSDSQRPHFESTPAGWLPTQREDKTIESYIVISAGKVVALDRTGCLVPAGLRKAFNKATGTTILTYTATDVAEYVVDLTTGEVVTAATSYTEAQVTQALKERGFIRPTERATDFISKPIGIASYDFNKAAGTDYYNPATLYEHNFRPQALAAVTCDYAITVPVLPAVATTETMANDSTSGATGLMEDYLDGTQTRDARWFTSTQIAEVVKYSSEVTAGDDVVAYVCSKYPIALDTAESTIEASVAGLVNEVASISAISAAGDYYIDYDLGVIFLYDADGDAIPSPWSTAATLTYYHYEDAVSASDARVTTYMCATGDLEYGDFLTYDDNSNLIKATLDIGTAEGCADSAGTLYSSDPNYGDGADATISLQLEKAISNYWAGIVGQVIGVNVFPRSGLERVKTAYAGQTAANMRTPGSATGGRTDQLTYAGGAERMLIVNLICR